MLAHATELLINSLSPSSDDRGVALSKIIFCILNIGSGIKVIKTNIIGYTYIIKYNPLTKIAIHITPNLLFQSTISFFYFRIQIHGHKRVFGFNPFFKLIKVFELTLFSIRSISPFVFSGKGSFFNNKVFNLVRLVSMS